MKDLEALAAVHGWAATEYVAWGWAATLDAEMREMVERALGRYGIDGLGDLLLAGSALGGLDAADVDALMAKVEAELGRELAAA